MSSPFNATSMRSLLLGGAMGRPALGGAPPVRPRVPYAWRIIRSVMGDQGGQGANWTAGNVNRTSRPQAQGPGSADEPLDGKEE
jgi:hypothetical protein